MVDQSRTPDSVRIDKWLWAARFFKTRGLASEAVHGGKIHVNGRRVKPAHPVRPGDRVEIHKGPVRFVVDVAGLAERRLAAPAAQALYEETPESVASRASEAEKRRAAARAMPRPVKRPDKRARRELRQFKGRE